MKNITSKSVRDWEAKWKAFMYLGLVLTAIIAGLTWQYGKKEFSPRFGWVLAAYGADGIGAAGLKIPDFNLSAGQIVGGLERGYLEQKNFRFTVLAFYWSPAVGYSLSLAILLAFGRVMARAKRADEHLRGAELADVKTLKKMLRGKPSNFCLGDIPIPVEMEPTHFLFAGGQGSGKTVAFLQALEAIHKKNQRAIIADQNGAFLATFFRDGDVILNPFDGRSVSWSPFAEMRRAWDADRLARSLIPDGEGESKAWNFYAQGLLSAIILRLWERDNCTNGELVRLLGLAGTAEVREMVAGLPAQRLFDPENARYVGNVLAIAAAYATLLAWLDPAAGKESFSIRDWVRQDGHGWIFFTYMEDQLDSLRPLIAAWAAVVASEILAMTEDRERRIWLVLDEFAGLGKIQSIEPFLTKARKAGGCAVLGLQSISQLHDTYGSRKAQTLLGCLGTWLVLRQTDPETREAMSLFLGEHEIRRQNESGSKGGDGSGNWSEQVDKPRIVIPSELKTLDPRHGYLSLLGDYPVCPVAIPLPDKRREAAPAFVLCDRFSGQSAMPKSFSGDGDGLDFTDW